MQDFSSYKWFSFPITTDLLNSVNFKVAITQLCNESQVWNFTML